MQDANAVTAANSLHLPNNTGEGLREDLLGHALPAVGNDDLDEASGERLSDR
jgi:hypothetical protein